MDGILLGKGSIYTVATAERTASCRDSNDVLLTWGCLNTNGGYIGGTPFNVTEPSAPAGITCHYTGVGTGGFQTMVVCIDVP